MPMMFIIGLNLALLQELKMKPKTIQQCNDEIERINKIKIEIEAKEQAKLDKMKKIIINKVEYELKQHDNNKKLSEIIIPKGWRLLLPSEAMMLYEKSLIDSSFWFYVKQTNKKEKLKGNVARFGADSDGAGLGCNGDPSFTNSALGVIFCRDIRRKK